MRFTFAILLFALNLVSLNLSAQDCNNTLPNANKHYEEGQFESGISELIKCIPYFDREEKQEAYRLLALMYQQIHDEANMDLYIRKLLNNNPDYVIESLSRDPVTFVKEIKKFTVFPKNEFGLSVGVSQIRSDVLKGYRTIENASYSYTPFVGYNFGISHTYNLSSWVSLQSRLFATGLGYNQEVKLNESETITYSESADGAGISIGIASAFYGLKNSRFLIDANVGLTYFYSVLYSSFYENPVKGTTNQYSFDVTDQRNTLLPSVQVGITYELKISRGEIGIRLGYDQYLLPNMSDDDIYADTKVNFSLLKVSDQLKYKGIGITAQYRIPINYHVRKVD